MLGNSDRPAGLLVRRQGLGPAPNTSLHFSINILQYTVNARILSYNENEGFKPQLTVRSGYNIPYLEVYSSSFQQHPKSTYSRPLQSVSNEIKSKL